MVWQLPVLIAFLVVAFSLLYKKVFVKGQNTITMEAPTTNGKDGDIPHDTKGAPEPAPELEVGLLTIIQLPTCRDVIGAYLRDQRASDTLLNLNILSKAIYKLTQTFVSEYFHLRITGDLPFERRTLTSVIIHSRALPNRETLLLAPAITRAHLEDYNEASGNILPPTVTRLSLSSLKNIPLPPGFLPASLTHLRFPEAFNSPVGVENLPPTTTHIFFNEEFNQRVDNLPISVTHLIFGAEFNQPVDRLPPALVLLCTDRCFQQPIESIPSTVQFLRLGSRFTHSISSIPPSITHLYLQNGLPTSTEKLPPYLKYLRCRLKLPLPPLPPTLTNLRLNPSVKVAYQHGVLPDSVDRFECVGPSQITLAQLPASIKSIILWDHFNEPLENFSRFGSLTSLVFGSKFNMPVDNLLPPQITNLDLGDEFNDTVDNLPPSLRHLKLGHEFDYSLDFLPGTLISLKIVGGSFNQNMRNLPGDLQILHFDTFALNVVNLHFVPGKLQHLHLSAGALGNARVSHLPDTLTYLSLTTEEDQAPLPIVALPPNLQTLELHGNYNPPGLGDLLPPTLKSLSLGYSFTESLDSLPPHLRVLETGATFNRRLPALPPTLRYFKRLNNDDIDLSLPKFPPRLFHVRSSKEYEELPPTCHKQPDHATYACSWCDELRGEHDYLKSDAEWSYANFK